MATEKPDMDIPSQEAVLVPFGATVMPLPGQVVGEGSLFVITMTGDAMINAAILDGDWVVVRRQPDAVDRDIVAVLIDDAATVRTFRRRDGHAWLMPNNPDYTPASGDTATILGKVVAIIRPLEARDAT
jgi:repressor LexA